MRAIMISIKPKWCALEMNGIKSIEVRKNKALANAIKKLIDENGYADIYVHCSKCGKDKVHLGFRTLNFMDKEADRYIKKDIYILDDNSLAFRGKVPFKFRCYKVEEIACNCLNNGVDLDTYYMTEDLDFDDLEKASCLTNNELRMYLGIGKNIQSDIVGYAIHISNLEIFDEPKELSEFYRIVLVNKLEGYEKPLTKAPQNLCYVEVE